jgi:hypothetical protein
MSEKPQGRPRLLLSGRSRLHLDSDARVTLWTSHDPALPPLVSPGSPGSQLGFLEVTPQRAEEEPVRTVLLASCGPVQVRDRLVPAAEPVGRAAPGVALARAVNCLDGPLDLTHVVRLVSSPAYGDVTWRSLNRLAFGYFADRKVTVDGGEVMSGDGEVTSRLRAEAGAWCVLTVAFDGHLPADPALVTTLFG